MILFNEEIENLILTAKKLQNIVNTSKITPSNLKELIIGIQVFIDDNLEEYIKIMQIDDTKD